MGRSGSDGGREFGEGFYRDAAGRLRDARGRFVASGEDIGRDTGRGFLGGFGKMMGRLAGASTGFLRASAPVAAYGSALLTLLPLMPQVAAGAASLGSAVLAAVPAMVALGVGAKIAKASLTAIFAEGSKAREALSPLGSMLTKAGEAGSAAAARGIRPLAEALRRVAQPVVTRYMEGVGRAANRVQKDFLRWAKSTEGVRTLKRILEPISAAMQRLAPHVSKAAIAFAKMLGEVMGVSMAAGSKGLAGALDWLTEKMNAVSEAKTAGALKKLKDIAVGVANAVRIVAGWLSKLYQAYKTYTTEFGLVADALAVVAMIFGGPVVTAIAAAGLIIRHFDQLKAAWERLKAAFQGGGGGGPIAGALQNMKSAAMTVVPALINAGKQIWAAIWPKLKEIGTLIKNELIPAFGEFMAAIAPFVAWLIGVLRPVVQAVFTAVLGVIKGALQIIVGILRVFTGIFTGDWSKAWSGIKSIASGLWTAIVAVFKGAFALIVAQLKAWASVIVAVVRPLIGALKSVFSSAWNGVVSVVRGAIGKVRSATSAVKNAVTGVFRGAGSWLLNAGRAIVRGLLSGIQSMIGAVRSKLSELTGMIPDWKGPMSVDLKLLQPSGAALMSGLVDGIAGAVPDVRKTLQGVTGDIPDYAAPRGVAQTANRSGGPQEIVIRSGGTRLDDALIEILRRAIADKGGNVQKVLGR